MTEELTKEIESAVKEATVDVSDTTDKSDVKTDESTLNDSQVVDGDEIDVVDDSDAEIVVDSSVDGEEKVVEKFEQPKISPEAITRAVRAGLSLSEAMDFPSDSSLMRIVDRIEAANRKQEEPIEKKVESDPLDAFRHLDPEKFEPEVIELFGKLTDVIDGQRKELGEFRSAHEVALQEKAKADAMEVESWFDSQVAKLGDEFSDSLGKGPYKSLIPGTPQYVKRDTLANHVAMLMAGARATSNQPPPRDELFSTAAKVVLAEEFQKAHEKRLTSDLAKRSSQHMNRVGGQHGKKSSDPISDTAALIDNKFFK